MLNIDFNHSTCSIIKERLVKWRLLRWRKKRSLMNLRKWQQLKEPRLIVYLFIVNLLFLLHLLFIIIQPPPPIPLPSLPPPPLLTLPVTRPPFLFDLVQSFLLIHSSYISFYLQIILYLLNCNCYSNCIFPRLKTLTWNLPSFNIYSSTFLGTSLSKWTRWSDYRWNRSFPKNIWCHH